MKLFHANMKVNTCIVREIDLFTEVCLCNGVFYRLWECYRV